MYAHGLFWETMLWYFYQMSSAPGGKEPLLEAKLDLSKTYAVALEGGGAKGAYQVGVWQAMEEAGVRFGYRQDCGCTTIVFRRPGSQLVGEAADVELDGRKRILALLSDGETRTSGAISEALGMSRRSTQRVLGLLEADGAVERVGGGRGTKWRRGDS